MATEKQAKSTGIFGPTLETLSDCAEVKESTVQNISEAYLRPMETEIKAAEQMQKGQKGYNPPTLAQQARYCRLQKLVEVLINVASVERRLQKWKSQNREKVDAIEDFWNTMTRDIIEQTAHIVEKWPAKSNKDEQRHNETQIINPKTKTGKLQIMDLAKARFVKMVESGDMLEYRIAALHNAIENILDSIMVVVKLFGRAGLRMKDRHGIFNPEDIVCYSIQYLKMNLPRKYLMTFNEKGERVKMKKPN